MEKADAPTSVKDTSVVPMNSHGKTERALGHDSECEMTDKGLGEMNLFKDQDPSIYNDDSPDLEDMTPTEEYLFALKDKDYERGEEILNDARRSVDSNYREIYIYLAVYYQAHDHFSKIVDIFDAFDSKMDSDSDAETVVLPNDPQAYVDSQDDYDNLVKHAIKKAIRLELKLVIEAIVKNEKSKVLIPKEELAKIY